MDKQRFMKRQGEIRCSCVVLRQPQEHNSRQFRQLCNCRGPRQAQGHDQKLHVATQQGTSQNTAVAMAVQHMW